MQSDRLQDELLNKEQARIEARRQRNENLRLRFLPNAKQRLIGVDKKGLDDQIEEKRRAQLNTDDILRMERAQAIEIERLLATAQNEERMMKEYQMNQLREDWERAREFKKKEYASRDRNDFDRERAGAASGLNMAGEDLGKHDRVRAQKEQMRQWVQEQCNAKKNSKQNSKDDDKNYAEMLKAIDEIRAQSEREEAEMRRYVQASVLDQNRELAAQQWARRHPPKDNTTTSLKAFDEDKGRAMDVNGRIIQKDMFKGFTKEQQAKMLMENQQLVEAKRREREQDADMDRYWAAQQVLAMRAMEQAEFENKLMRDSLKEDQLAVLRDQIVEQKQARQAWDATKRGGIDINKGFFDGFGKSHR